MPNTQLSAKSTDAAPAVTDYVTVVKASGSVVRSLLSVLPFKLPTTNSIVRTLFAKGGDYPTVADYGMDPTGVTPCDTAFANMLADGLRVIQFGIGTYRFNSQINVTESVSIYGISPLHTKLVSYASGAQHGMRIIGNAGLGRANTIELRNFDFGHAGTAQTTAGAGAGLNNWAGLYVQRKVLAYNVWVHDFTNDGVYFAPSDADESTASVGTDTNAVFFSEWTNCRSNDNGRDGWFVRAGANGNRFVNCQGIRNKRDGLHQYTDGASTYANQWDGGQYSYNSRFGCNWENGTDISARGIYAEYNQSPDNTDTNGYSGSTQDHYVGDTCVETRIEFLALLGSSIATKNSRVRAPAFNPSRIQIWQGGRRIYGDP